MLFFLVDRKFYTKKSKTKLTSGPIKTKLKTYKMRISLQRFVKFGGNLKELRLHLSQTGEESKGVR